MEKFVVSNEFKGLNVGLALDEGIASPDEAIPMFYGERNVYWVRFHCKGKLMRLALAVIVTLLSKVCFAVAKIWG